MVLSSTLTSISLIFCLKRSAIVTALMAEVSGRIIVMEHFYTGFTEGKADACLAASVFHFGEMTVGEVKEYLNKKGVSVRI